MFIEKCVKMILSSIGAKVNRTVLILKLQVNDIYLIVRLTLLVYLEIDTSLLKLLNTFVQKKIVAPNKITYIHFKLAFRGTMHYV